MTASSADPREERILVHTVLPGDAVHTSKLLRQAGIACERCPDAETLCRMVREAAGAVFVAEETLQSGLSRQLLAALDEQPAWSDLPIIVSVVARETIGAGYGVIAALGEQANVILLERPVSARTMVHAVQGALRQRRRQYETRALVEELALALDTAEAESRAKDDFLATLSHELRTPLNAILGWTQMMRSGRMPPDRFARVLEVIERNAVAQAQLVEDLLDVSRVTTGKLRLSKQRMDLCGTVRAALEAVRPTAESRGVTLETTLEPEVCFIVGDTARLQQVVWNLLSNAVKFSRVGGHIAVTLAPRGKDVELTVKDDGAGIPPDFLPHVFERFRQADPSVTRSHGGLGIGLSIVKSIVELHGGDVSASSDGEGKGATFIVHLPTGPADGPSARAIAASGPGDGLSSRLSGLRVVVVDDEADSVELLAEALRSCGASVVAARSAQEAFAEITSHPPHVIVSDIGMRDEDGYSLIRRVRSSAPKHIPALAVTAYTRVEDRARALSAGFDMHLAKPVAPADLVSHVELLARQFAEPSTH